MDEKGHLVYNGLGDPVLDIASDLSNALYNQYPKQFSHPDLMIAHIGSIKTFEFEKVELATFAAKSKERPLLFYPNHLRVRGLAILLDNVRPVAAIISEFGEELKDVRFPLSRGIEHYLTKRESTQNRTVRVIPGDLTIVYDIERAQFLCHDTMEYHSPSEIAFHDIPEPKDSRHYYERRVVDPKDAGRETSEIVKRTYLFAKQGQEVEAMRKDVKKYHTNVICDGQPYHKR